MLELIIALAAAMAIVLASIGWRHLSQVDGWQEGDVRASITPVPDGTVRVVVSNPGPQPVVVTAYARPANRLRWWGPGLVSRRPSRHERRNSHHVFRQLLGSVPSRGESTWIVAGEVANRPVYRIVLGVYHTAGRVRMHEAVVRTQPLTGGRISLLDLLGPAPAKI